MGVVPGQRQPWEMATLTLFAVHSFLGSQAALPTAQLPMLSPTNLLKVAGLCLHRDGRGWKQTRRAQPTASRSLPANDQSNEKKVMML